MHITHTDLCNTEMKSTSAINERMEIKKAKLTKTGEEILWKEFRYINKLSFLKLPSQHIGKRVII